MKRHVVILILALGLSAFFANVQCLGQIERDSTTALPSPPDSSLERKSPTGALLRSVAFPGWGQFYNRRYLKSVVVFGAEATFITMAVVDWSRMSKHKKNFQNPDYPDRYWEFEQFEFYEDRRNLFLWITAGIVFLSMFDAYVDAHLYNFDQEEVRDLSISLVPGTNREDEIKIALSVRF